ncbi:MAG TPA: thioredoxin [Campylobacterales bacterium]|nr:thioredoxin [Campylobacterales bacterium]
MKKVILSMVVIVMSLLAHDFGDVPEKKLDEIKKDRPLMVMVGKTKCIWCDNMAPQIREIKEQYPQTVIYYVNVDKDFLGAINHNIEELPVQLFYDKNGKEVDRHTGYLGKDSMMEALRKYGILVER